MFSCEAAGSSTEMVVRWWFLRLPAGICSPILSFLLYVLLGENSALHVLLVFAAFQLSH